MSDADRSLDVSLSPAPPGNTGLVPAGFAEKAMASLMQLHTQLMDEKERRVDLYRRLMDREQALAEMRMYVKLLEEKVAAAAPVRPKNTPPTIPPVSAPGMPTTPALHGGKPPPAGPPPTPGPPLPTAAPRSRVSVAPVPPRQETESTNRGVRPELPPLIAKAASSWRSW